MKAQKTKKDIYLRKNYFQSSKLSKSQEITCFDKHQDDLEGLLNDNPLRENMYCESVQSSGKRTIMNS